MKTSNIKDLMTTIAGILMAVAITIMGLPTAIAAIAPTAVFTMPAIVNVICGFIIAISLVITGILNGKNPDGSTKSIEQIVNQNNQAK